MAAGNNPEPVVVALLLLRGADATALDEDGETPEDFAADRETPDEEILRLLRGDVTPTDYLGLRLRRAASLDDLVNVSRLLKLGVTLKRETTMAGRLYTRQLRGAKTPPPSPTSSGGARNLKRETPTTGRLCISLRPTTTTPP